MEELENGEHGGPSLLQYGDAFAVMASGLLGERGWDRDSMDNE